MKIVSCAWLSERENIRVDSMLAAILSSCCVHNIFFQRISEQAEIHAFGFYQRHIVFSIQISLCVCSRAVELCFLHAVPINKHIKSNMNKTLTNNHDKKWNDFSRCVCVCMCNQPSERKQPEQTFSYSQSRCHFAFYECQMPETRSRSYAQLQTHKRTCAAIECTKCRWDHMHICGCLVKFFVIV